MSDENVEIHKIINDKYHAENKSLNQHNLETLKLLNRNVSLPEIGNYRTIE
jgi:hypothetical protein